jgi:hypothetical protein
MTDAREIYREWKRNIKEDAREFGQWRLDNMSSYGDLDYHYEQFLSDLAMSLDEINVKDAFKWLTLAEKEIHKIKEKLVKRFPEITQDDDESQIEKDDPIVFAVSGGKEFEIAGHKRRKRLFPDLASLVDYIKDVPYPAGIQIIRDDNNKVVGYYIWVEK